MLPLFALTDRGRRRGCGRPRPAGAGRPRPVGGGGRPADEVIGQLKKYRKRVPRFFRTLFRFGRLSFYYRGSKKRKKGKLPAQDKLSCPTK